MWLHVSDIFDSAEHVDPKLNLTKRRLLLMLTHMYDRFYPYVTGVDTTFVRILQQMRAVCGLTLTVLQCVEGMASHQTDHFGVEWHPFYHYGKCSAIRAIGSQPCRCCRALADDYDRGCVWCLIMRERATTYTRCLVDSGFDCPPLALCLVGDECYVYATEGSK